jgi:hypothetical protein
MKLLDMMLNIAIFIVWGWALFLLVEIIFSILSQ